MFWFRRLRERGIPTKEGQIYCPYHDTTVSSQEELGPRNYRNRSWFNGIGLGRGHGCGFGRGMGCGPRWQCFEEEFEQPDRRSFRRFRNRCRFW